MNAAATTLPSAICAALRNRAEGQQPRYRVFHLLRDEEGERGGYTVAMKPRKDGRLNVTLSQCKETQKYDMRLGEKIAVSRMKQGKYFVCPPNNLASTLTALDWEGQVVMRDLDAQLKVVAERVSTE
jgi:hypothetical protein